MFLFLIFRNAIISCCSFYRSHSYGRHSSEQLCHSEGCHHNDVDFQLATRNLHRINGFGVTIGVTVIVISFFLYREKTFGAKMLTNLIRNIFCQRKSMNVIHSVSYRLAEAREIALVIAISIGNNNELC